MDNVCLVLTQFKIQNMEAIDFVPFYQLVMNLRKINEIP